MRLPLLIAVLLCSCSERGFREVPPVDSDQDDPSEPDPSRWDVIQPGDRPEVLLAAAWTDRDAIDIGIGRFRCELSYEAARYGFWDLEGRLVVELDPPGELAHRAPTHSRSLSRWGSAALLARSIDAEGVHHAWVGDGATGEVRELLTWHAPGSGQIQVHGHEQPLHVGSPLTELLVHADPGDPGAVWLAPVRDVGERSLDEAVLYRIDLEDPSRQASWTAPELLREFDRTVDVDGFRPNNLHVRQHDGHTVVALDLAGERHDADGLQLVGPGIVVVFEPSSERIRWTHEVSHAPAGPAAFSLDTEGDAGWLGSAYSSVDGGFSANFDRSDAGPATLGSGADGGPRLECPRTALLLDAPSGTAAFGAVLDDSGEQPGPGVVVLVHRDEEILRLDALREGLSTNSFLLHDLALIDGP